MVQRDEKYLFKLIMLGSSGTGKTCVLARFVQNEFLLNNKSTIGVDFKTKVVSVKGKSVQAQIWDTAGQERFRGLSAAFFRNAKGVLLCYDITKPETFDDLPRWLDQCHQYGDQNMVILLIGNKVDLKYERAVSTEQGVQFAKANGLFFIETSALDATNIDLAFNIVLEKIQENLETNESRSRTEPRVAAQAPKKEEEITINLGKEKPSAPASGGCC